MTEGESPGADRAGHRTALPPEQEAIRARCYHPSGRFIPFPEAAVERSIPARFEETARLYPDWLAVKTRNRALTYEELNEAANRVAHALVALRGAGEEPIALLMEKGDSLIAAILGVMKAAKFYVPLDPSFPRERTRYMLGDSGAGVILTTGRHHSLATELARDGIEVMNIEALDPGLSAENPGLELSADSLSWLLYTSGSTGQPKGVLQNHRNILHRIMSYTNALHVSAEDRLVLLHSMSVSGGTTYALAALLNGAALLPFGLEEYGLGNLTDWLIEERITIYNSVPTIFRHLAGILNGRTTFPAMRVIRLGGEPVHKTDVDLYIEHFPPHCIFVNELGSTEAEVMRRYFVDPSTRIPGPTVPVGYAIEGKEVLLLDDDGNEVEFGRIGEIAVKSRYLCVGYWRLPRLTEATFLPDPAGGTGHIYRTGDLGRMRSDQCLEHLGRKDFQVKVRGYRVELPEIEMALGRVDGLKHAIVATWEDIPGHASLVGYVVPSRHPAPTVSEIRSGLSHKLPGHMVPAHFVYLDALPLTPNGKVDRRALPAPDPARPELDRPFVAPRTPTEQALVRIWGDVLGVRQVGIHDHFLDLGGDSLLASRVVSRVIDTFQVELLPQLLSTAPTVADMAVAIAQHSVAEKQRIPRQEAAGPCPLSFGQQRLWFTNQMDPTSAAYNMPRAVRIRGSLNRVALQRALDTIVARHEVLRTTYTATDGKPMQVVGQPRGVALPVIDLRESPEVERAAELERLILSETQRPFDLSRDLMLRAALFWSGEDEHVLLLVTYHIASDRWSAGVLFRELATAYQALSRGDRPVLPELPIQYTDFTLWQRHRLQGTILKDLLAYWTRQLGDYSSVLELPADRPRPAIQTARGAIESTSLSASLTESLRTLGRAEGATLYMTLLAAFQTLLNRYTGQDDIAVGSPIAGRTRVETEELIGFFVNTLVVRTDLSGNPTFRELLARVRRVALEAYAHQDLPFEKLVEELQPRRSATHSPLYQVVFALRNTPRFTPELSGLIATPLEVDRKSAPNDVVLYMTESERGLSAALEYSTDLFDATTMARMLGHFATLLQGIVADPDTPIGALPLLTDAERRQLLDEWNDRSGAHPVGTCIHHMFEVQAGRTPDAIAVAFEGVHLTYRELNRQANQVAHHLRALGVGPDVLVGTCMEPSPRIVISLLGILKAGGAYLPLDPAYPRERLAFMLEDSRTSILLADRPGLAALPANGARVVCLDTDGERIATESHEDPECRVSAEHLAYVIYTSGSTGRPKGVMVPHRGLGHVVHAQVRAFDVGPGSRVLQFNSLSFDASIFEIVMALCTGATLCLGTRDALLPGPALGRFLRDHAITTMTLPPSALAALPREEFPRLRTITVAGEACSAELVARWAGGRRFFNLYGTTEATIWSTMAECNDAQATPSIGRPIPGAELYILDPSEQLVPIGIPGELYVGGVGVARGYLNRPELTAATFVANPFSDEPGARLCKTGDLARYLPDGNVELLGRIDQQVKIRGFRVEPGEIETVLEQHAGVRQALVLARTGASGETHLVAYVVPKEEEPPLAAVLRSFLTQRLPDYMAPSFFVTLEALPLLPNQKVNRAALPAPDEAGPASEDGFVAARTPVEAALVQIWAEVLGRERVGVHDDFFELGGHSLLAAQILSRVLDVFQVELPLRAFFEAPTIASVAAIIGRCQTE